VKGVQDAMGVSKPHGFKEIRNRGNKDATSRLSMIRRKARAERSRSALVCVFLGFAFLVREGTGALNRSLAIWEEVELSVSSWVNSRSCVCVFASVLETRSWRVQRLDGPWCAASGALGC
jgi:hypothetical protein